MSTENSGKNRGNVGNLVPHQFKAGESGTPGGRPKRAPITDYVKAQLEQPIPETMKEKLAPIFFELYGTEATFGQMLAFRLVTMATQGDLGALREILDRVEGKVSQKMALAGESGGPVAFTFTRLQSK